MYLMLVGFMFNFIIKLQGLYGILSSYVELLEKGESRK